MKKLLLLLAFGAFFARAKAQYSTLLTQDFSGSTDYTTYTAGANRFTFIGSDNLDNGTTTQISITDGKLTFEKTDNSKAAAMRGNLNAAFVKVSFDFSVSGNTSELANPVVISYGDSFAGNNTGNPSKGSTHSRIFLAFQGTNGNFSVLPFEDTTPPVPTDAALIFSGEQTISWFINNTGNTVTYPAPDGTDYSLANDSYDVWVGTGTTAATQKLIINGHAAVTASADLNSFKIGYINGTGTIQIDNVVVQSFTPLPVDLVSFTGESANNNIRLHWATASELNNSHFEVQRSTDGKSFATIATLPGKGTISAPGYYTLTDKSPVQGINYYRLRQVDFNGNTHESSIIAVRYTLQIDNFRVYVNDNLLHLYMQSSEAGLANLDITDITGKQLLSSSFNIQKGINTVSMAANGLSGRIFIARLNMGGTVKTIKFSK